jgi:hypothetical protein
MKLSILETLLAGLNVDRDLRDAVIGDLREERARRAASHGDAGAERWLRRQIGLSALHFVGAAIRAGGLRLPVATVGAAVGALVLLAPVIGVSSVLWSIASLETVGRLAIVALFIDLAFGAAGGYVAARLGTAAPLGAACMFGLLGVTLTIVAGAHGVYAVALQVLIVPATVTGGWLRARRLAGATDVA